MKSATLPPSRVRKILSAASKVRAIVVGDAMLDQFIWGHVSRISPEAPVPVVDFESESFIPGGAANVARNLTSLKAATRIFSVVGNDGAAAQLKDLLLKDSVNCDGLVSSPFRSTSLKTRVIAHRQQICRIDRESRRQILTEESNKLLAMIKKALDEPADAVIIGDYGKGVVDNLLLHEVKKHCRERGVWLSLDPKPVHNLELTGLSLITPNRKEAFELASLTDDTKNANPLKDEQLLLVAERLLNKLNPALLLITLGELGMLLCERGKKPFHIPTRAQAVFDVSGAGDTVIASFTLAIAAGASPVEAAILSNHAAGIVVGKVGTATTTPEELIRSFTEE
jgi:D-beta-D-heptose 7-phosphate kinase/D-beta-D-heptose 1-phosphate adenosyltransferase